MCTTCGCSGQTRLEIIERDILADNTTQAEANRQWLRKRSVLAFNLMSSPGSGKTSLLVHTLTKLAGEMPLAVIEGDQQTERDAERIRAAGVAAVVQINTGKACHLDAHRVARVLPELVLAPGSVLFIENVGNLVCPAVFDLGETAKVVILSVTEGDDKPLKYPDIFHAADLLLITKTDLLPHVDFDVARCTDYARRINPGLQVLSLSARTGEGMAAWCDWVRAQRDEPRSGEHCSCA